MGIVLAPVRGTDGDHHAAISGRDFVAEIVEGDAFFDGFAP